MAKCATLDLDEGELFPLMTDTDMIETEETTEISSVS